MPKWWISGVKLNDDGGWLSASTVTEQIVSAANEIAYQEVKCGLPQPFMNHWWIRDWARHFLRTEHDLICANWDDRNIYGFLPMYVAKRKIGMLSWQILQVVGTPGAGWVGILDDEKKCFASDRVAHALRKSTKNWDIAILQRFRTKQGATTLAGAMRSIGLSARIYPCAILIGTSNYSSGQEYLASRNRPFMATKRHSFRQLRHQGKIRIELFGAAHTRPCKEALHLVDGVVSHSWQGNEMKSIFSPSNEKIRAFHYGILNSSSHQHYAPTIAVLMLNEEAIAYQYGFQSCNHYTSYAREYDKRFHKFSPGRLLNSLYMPVLIDMGVKSVDFGVGDAWDKRKWGDWTETLYSVYLFHGGWRSRLFQVCHDLRRSSKRAFFWVTGKNLFPD